MWFVTAVTLSACSETGGAAASGAGTGGTGAISGVGGGTGGVGAVGGGVGGFGGVAGDVGGGSGGSSGTGGGASGSGGVGGNNPGNVCEAPMYGLPGGRCSDGTTVRGTPECVANSEGIFAIKGSIDVWWNNGRNDDTLPVVMPGRGIINSYFAVHLFQANDHGLFNGYAQPCGMKLPPFRAVAKCEAYEANFSPTGWNNIDMIPVTGRWDRDGRDPTDLFLQPPGYSTLDSQTVLLGINVTNPAGTWPSASQIQTGDFSWCGMTGANCFPDADKDGFPGLTGVMRIGGAPYDNEGRSDPGCLGAPREFYGAPPQVLDALNASAPRIGRIFIGVRVGLAGRIDVPSCDPAASGTGNGVTNLTDGRAWDCEMTPYYECMNPILGMVPCAAGDAGAVLKPAAPCPTSASDFLDSNLPTYTTLQIGEPVPAMLNGRAVDASGWDLDTQAGRGTTYSARRLGNLGDAATCEQVIAAFN